MRLRVAGAKSLSKSQRGVVAILLARPAGPAAKPAFSTHPTCCQAHQAGIAKELLSKPVRPAVVEEGLPNSLQQRSSNGEASTAIEYTANRGGEASTSKPTEDAHSRGHRISERQQAPQLSKELTEGQIQMLRSKGDSIAWHRPRRKLSRGRAESAQGHPVRLYHSSTERTPGRNLHSDAAGRNDSGNGKRSLPIRLSKKGEVKAPKAEDREDSPAKVLNSVIVEAKSAEEVLQIVDQQGGKFNAVNAATAFHRLGKHCTRMPDDAVVGLRKDARTRRLAEIVESFAESWGGRALNSIAWVEANVRLGPPSLVLKVETRFFEKLLTMETQEVSGVCMALAKAGCLTDESFEKLGRLLPAWIKHHEPNAHERWISNLMWPYAKLSRQDSVVFANLAQATKTCLQQPVSTRGLANLAWSFAKVDYKDERLFDLLAYRSVQALRDHSQSQSQRAQDADRSEPSVMNGSWAVVPLHPHDLANLAWAFGRAFAAAVQTPSQHYLRDDGWMLEYMARVPARQLVFECVWDHLPHCASRLSDVGMSSLVWGFATARVYDLHMLNHLAACAIRAAPTYSFQAITVTYWAFSTLRHDVPDLYEALATSALSLLDEHGSVEVLNEVGANMLIMGAAHINASHLPATRELMLRMAAWAQDHLEEYTSAKGLACLAWGLACMGLLDPGLLRKVCIRMTHQSGPIERELCQLYQADLALRLLPHPDSPSAPRPTDISQFLHECYTLGRLRIEAFNHWRKLLITNFRSITGLHWSVATSLHELGVHFRMEFEAEDYSMDIALEGQRMAIEVDGPFHFSRNTRRPLGFHMLKERLLTRQGWRVLHVPFYHWERLSTCEEQQAYLFRILHDADVRCAVTDTLALQLAEEPPAYIVKMLQEAGLTKEACGKLDLADIDGGFAEEPQVEVKGTHADQSDDGEQEDGVDRKQEGEKITGKLSASDRMALRQYSQRGLSKHQLLVQIARGKAQ